MVLWATSPPHPPPKVGVPQGATFGPALVAHYAFSLGDPILSHEISCRLENVTSQTYTVGLHLYGIESKVRVGGKKACSLFFQLNKRQGSRLKLGVIRKRACFEDQNHRSGGVFTVRGRTRGWGHWRKSRSARPASQSCRASSHGVNRQKEKRYVIRPSLPLIIYLRPSMPGWICIR